MLIVTAVCFRCSQVTIFILHPFSFSSPLRSPIAVAVTLILGIDTKFSQRVIHPCTGFCKNPSGMAMVCVSYVKIYIQIAFLSFQFVSEEMHRGMPCLKYERKIKKFNKSNTYSFYISKIKPHRPLRYEMVGYDDMLTSHYDRYILDYVTFEPWKFNRSLFNLPKSRFSSKSDA